MEREKEIALIFKYFEKIMYFFIIYVISIKIKKFQIITYIKIFQLH